MHVSAFYASSVQLGTHPHIWLHCIYTCELAFTKRTCMVQHNTTNTCEHAQSVIVKPRPQRFGVLRRCGTRYAEAFPRASRDRLEHQSAGDETGHRARVLKTYGSNDLKGSGLCIMPPTPLCKRLNNTEVKGHYSTICRHACFSFLRLISAAWYTSTYMAALYLYT